MALEIEEHPVLSRPLRQCLSKSSQQCVVDLDAERGRNLTKERLGLRPRQAAHNGLRGGARIDPGPVARHRTKLVPQLLFPVFQLTARRLRGRVHHEQLGPLLVGGRLGRQSDLLAGFQPQIRLAQILQQDAPRNSVYDQMVEDPQEALRLPLSEIEQDDARQGRH